MDKHHDAQLPIIKRLSDELLHVSRTWMEPKAITGETPDLFSVVEFPVDILGDFKLFKGQTIVGDYKSSVADLRADNAKAWRAQRALGTWRLVWLRSDGAVRPEHVDEGKGWGVVMFDDFNAQVVREPPKHHDGSIAWDAQTELIVRLMRQDKQPGQRDKRKHVAKKKIDEAIELIAQGPLTTGQVKRLIGYKGTKLADELEKDGRAVQDGVGGNWRLKDASP